VFGFLRILVLFLIGRILLGFFRAIASPSSSGNRRREAPGAQPERSRPRRPAGGDIVDAEFEDLETGPR